MRGGVAMTGGDESLGGNREAQIQARRKPQSQAGTENHCRSKGKGQSRLFPFPPGLPLSS